MERPRRAGCPAPVRDCARGGARRHQL